MGEGGQKLRDVIYGRPLRKSERERKRERGGGKKGRKKERERENL